MKTDRNPRHFEFFAVLGQNSVFPELRLFSHPEQLIQSEFSGKLTWEVYSSSFLPSTPIRVNATKAQNT